MKVRVIRKNNGRYYVQRQYFGIWIYLDHRYRLSMFDGYLPEWFNSEDDAIDFIDTYKKIVIRDKENEENKKIADKIDKTYTPKVIDL